jgi:glutamate racemase
MDNRPIGFFDSGLGGLTCIPHLLESLPEEKIIYFGDTARTPYGSKTVSTIQGFSIEIADFLIKNDVKMLVIACNTVSAVALEKIRDKFPGLPVTGIIEPAAERTAVICSAKNKIGVIGTKATIISGAYERYILNANDGLKVFSVACPAFVPLIEEGIIKNDIMNLAIQYYLDDFILENRIDTLILGCTHYPFIRGNIERLYPDLEIIDPSREIITIIKKTLEERDMFAKNSGYENTFYASDLSKNFMDMIANNFGVIDISVKFKNLEG